MGEERLLQTKILGDLRGMNNGWATKIEKASDNGVPDVFGTVVTCGPFLIEVKAPGKKPEPHQITIHATLRRCGCRTFSCDSWERWVEIKRELGLLPPTT